VSGAPQQVPTSPGPPNRAGPTASVGSNPLPPMPLPPTITSRKAAVFSNISWEGKHPFQMSRADLKLTLYRFLKQYLLHERPGYYSPATFTPHGALLPTCSSDHLSLQTPARITGQNSLSRELLCRGYSRSCEPVPAGQSQAHPSLSQIRPCLTSFAF
jgi:hypothetical protein